MELTDATNEFVGSYTFTILVLTGIFVMAILLRLLFGQSDQDYSI